MSFPAEEEQYVGVWEVIGKIYLHVFADLFVLPLLTKLIYIWSSYNTHKKSWLKIIIIYLLLMSTSGKWETYIVYIPYACDLYMYIFLYVLYILLTYVMCGLRGVYI